MDVGTSAWKDRPLMMRFAPRFYCWHFSAGLIYGVYYSSLRDDVSASKPRRCSGNFKGGKGECFLLGSPIRGINDTDDFTNLCSLWFLGWSTTHRLLLGALGSLLFVAVKTQQGIPEHMLELNGSWETSNASSWSVCVEKKELWLRDFRTLLEHTFGKRFTRGAAS